MNITWSKQEKSKLIECINSGMETKEICTCLNRTYNEVYKKIKRMGYINVSIWVRDRK